MHWFSSVSAHPLDGRGGLNNFILPRLSIAFNALAVSVLLLAAANSTLKTAT
jgi:hypothetical protein